MQKSGAKAEMRLWTFQSEAAWQVLQRDGVLHAPTHEDYILHKWMAEQMMQRVGPPPTGADAPLWLWHRRGAKHGPPPRLTSESAVWDAPQYVRLEIEVPERAVLLSDYWAWENLEFFHGLIPGGNGRVLYPLRDEMKAAGLLADQLLEGFSMDELVDLEAAGYPGNLEYHEIKRAITNPQIGPHIRKTWEAIFDIDLPLNPLSGWDCDDNRWLQATIWELRLEQVNDVRVYENQTWKRMSARQKLAHEEYPELSCMMPLPCKVTGLPKLVWVSEQNGVRRRPSVMLSASRKPIPGDWGQVSISDYPHGRGVLNKVSPEDLRHAKDWIKLNKQILLEHWHHGLDETDLLRELKPLSRQPGNRKTDARHGK